MTLYNIPEIEHKNLMVFLSRVQLTGAEVNEFNKVVYALSNPIQFDNDENDQE